MSDDVGKLEYLLWLNTIPKANKQTLLESLERNESFTYKAYQAAHASQQARIDALEAKLAEVSKELMYWKVR